DGDLTAASKILYGDIPALKQQLRDAEEQESDDASAQRPMVADHVGPDDIAEVVEAWTGIPSGRLLQGETEKLLEMEEIIGRRLIGQQRAVAEVSDAVRRARAGISDPHRPTGSFLFLGPTGVGKTELAKALAEFLFDDERAMIRIDMSEYGEKHTVSRLVGAPPGYVGYDQGGQLTEAVRRRPYSVVLLDEIEKAHQDVFDVLLQVLDDGRLTDGQGRTVDFRSTILILTSNLGAVALQDQTLAEKEKHDRVMQVVRASFKPEFLNRLDDIVMFEALDREQLSSIVALQVQEVAERLRERRITLDVDESATRWLAAEGFDPLYGARPLKRLVQKEIGDGLARLILRGEVQDGQRVLVRAAADGLELEVDRRDERTDGDVGPDSPAPGSADAGARARAGRGAHPVPPTGPSALRIPGHRDVPAAQVVVELGIGQLLLTPLPALSVPPDRLLGVTEELRPLRGDRLGHVRTGPDDVGDGVRGGGDGGGRQEIGTDVDVPVQPALAGSDGAGQIAVAYLREHLLPGLPEIGDAPVQGGDRLPQHRVLADQHPGALVRDAGQRHDGPECSAAVVLQALLDLVVDVPHPLVEGGRVLEESRHRDLAHQLLAQTRSSREAVRIQGEVLACGEGIVELPPLQRRGEGLRPRGERAPVQRRHAEPTPWRPRQLGTHPERIPHTRQDAVRLRAEVLLLGHPTQHFSEP